MMLRRGRWLGLAYLALAQARTIPGSARDAVRSATALAIDASKFLSGSNETITLTSTAGSPAIVTLDYGHSVEGIPSFEVVSADGEASVLEITYGESRAVLDRYMVSIAAKVDVMHSKVADLGSRTGRFPWQLPWTRIESIVTISLKSVLSRTVLFKEPFATRSSIFHPSAP